MLHTVSRAGDCSDRLHTWQSVLVQRFIHDAGLDSSGNKLGGCCKSVVDARAAQSTSHKNQVSSDNLSLQKEQHRRPRSWRAIASRKGVQVGVPIPGQVVVEVLQRSLACKQHNARSECCTQAEPEVSPCSHMAADHACLDDLSQHLKIKSDLGQGWMICCAQQASPSRAI